MAIILPSPTICPQCSRRTYHASLKRTTPMFPKLLKSRILQKRFVSTTHTATGDTRSFTARLKNILLGTAISLTLLVGYAYITDTRASFHLFTPSLLKYIYDDAEDAHEAGNRWLRILYGFGLNPRERGEREEGGDLAIEVRRWPLPAFEGAEGMRKGF